jgi:hypothetical protein
MREQTTLAVSSPRSIARYTAWREKPNARAVSATVR